jgi:hypothetical protein
MHRLFKFSVRWTCSAVYTQFCSLNHEPSMYMVTQEANILGVITKESKQELRSFELTLVLVLWPK